MASSTGDDAGADLAHLLEEARALQARLRRIAVALALSEEVIGDAYERRADSEAAARARVIAEYCRIFAAGLPEL